jgi:hypothetical protein
VLFLSFFCFTKNSEAAEYYVAPDGNDVASGTIVEPFKTFLPALTRAQAGDTIYARGGTYDFDNAMVRGIARDASSAGATSCPEGQKLTDGYCFKDAYGFISIKDFSGWASNHPAYSIASGAENNPITVRNYPGETPILDLTDQRFDPGFPPNGEVFKRAVTVGLKAYWVIEGFEIMGGIVNVEGGTQSAQTHDITIKNNNIHDIACDGGDNPGIVRIDRGDWGGPYNIFIHGNKLHGIYDWEQPNQWDGVIDAQHFGAVTMLSRQSYLGFEGGGTGYIEIKNNEIYEVPQAFFFKNCTAGPVLIENNIIHDCGSLGTIVASNMHFVRNLSYNVDRGFRAMGNNSDGIMNDPRLVAIAGQNATVEYNTFVGLDLLMSLWTGTGHTIRNNIFCGLNSRVQGANWDTPAYISKSEVYTDAENVAESLLQQVTSNNNCFISPHSDFQFASRYMPSGVEHYTYTQARNIFGFDPDSLIIIRSDPQSIFVDAAQSNFHLQDPSICPNMGYYADLDMAAPANPTGLNVS